MIKVPYTNFKKQWIDEKKFILKIISDVYKKGQFVSEEEVKKFEVNLAKFCGVRYAVGLNSGTDALTLGLLLLGIRKGDEVITPPNSFISSTSCITHIGAKPVFVDVLDDQNINPYLIEKSITKKTKAIMAVHLTGRIANMEKINQISKKYKIPIIEDAAQSIGSKFNRKLAGSFGTVGCFSCHPLKNLNASGDSGFLTTNNFKLYKQALNLRNNGIENRNVIRNFGYLSRMDVLQSKILNFRLKKLNGIIKKRRKHAETYFNNLDRKKIKIVFEKKSEFNTYHTFIIHSKKRDKLKKYLLKNGIETAIHYPVPIHLQPAAKSLNYKLGDFPITEKQSKEILTLPINQYLNKKDILYVCKMINKFND
tara:strand:- start:1857 stop:2957 length:1101 start_codon:yes stop_codon:yes gene_type:complete